MKKRAIVKMIRDTVHGDVYLTKEEIQIVDTPEFQRLRGIRQLGTSYMVFPGAHHSRFEHSIGTCWLTGRMIREINWRAERNGLMPVISEAHSRFLRIAALLHDITHIPFGHTFEDERRILPAHDNNLERLHYFLQRGVLGALLKKLRLDENLVDFFSAGKKKKPQYAYQLVAGPICADLLDYLKRDAFFCGLNFTYDDRIFRYLNIESGQLCFDLYNDRGFRQDAWSELINLLRIRYHLTERVYYHHAKTISGAMLSRILEALIEAKGIQVEELYKLRDDGFLLLLEQRIQKIPNYKRLLDAFLSRQLYKRVYMVGKDPLDLNPIAPEKMERFRNAYHLNQGKARSRLEKRLARKLGIPASAIIIYAPETNMRMKEAHVMVRVDSKGLKNLAEIKHPELDALHKRHQALWKFYLFMAPEYEEHFVKASKFLEKELDLDNQLELSNKGQLAIAFS